MGVSKNITKEQIILCMKKLNTVFEISEELGISTVTLRKYMKMHNIDFPPGFYKTGATIGCPKGYKQTENHIEKRLEHFRRNGTPFKGRKHTEETKMKMSQNHADFTGNKNPFKNSLIKNPENLEKARQRRRDYWANLSDEKRKEVLSNFSKAQANHPHHHDSGGRNYKYGYIETVKGGRIFVRSSWEKWVAEQLDLLDVVEYFEFEKLKITYIYEDVKRYTKSDFVIQLKNGLKILMEVKPKGIQVIKNNPVRIFTYQNYCDINEWKFILLDEDVVFNIDIFEEMINGLGKSL